MTAMAAASAMVFHASLSSESSGFFFLPPLERFPKAPDFPWMLLVDFMVVNAASLAFKSVV